MPCALVLFCDICMDYDIYNNKDGCSSIVLQPDGLDGMDVMINSAIGAFLSNSQSR